MTNVNQTSNDSVVNEEEIYAEELGTIVFQSALMKYLVTQDESKATTFNTFIEAYIGTETFLEDLCNEYPEFEKILREEMLLLQKELEEIVPD